METMYLLYDSRYLSQPDRATVYTVSESLEEAKKDQEVFPDGIIVKNVISEENVVTKKEIITEEKQNLWHRLKQSLLNT